VMSIAGRRLRSLLPNWAVESARRLVERIDPFLVISFSQEGEDLIVRRKFEGIDRGFYVDIGAHHPARFSNTLAFYRRGWSGINIDPNPSGIGLFQRARPNDINLCVGIADTQGILLFHEFDEPALSTFDPELADGLAQNTAYRLLERREVQVQPLADILQEHLPENQGIDLMTVDVEGFDLRVLKSNDWTRFRARCLLVEARDFDLARPDENAVHRFASSVGYRLIAKTVNTLVYEDAQSDQSPPTASGTSGEPP
jgi:FkbM family methyltransferase